MVIAIVIVIVIATVILTVIVIRSNRNSSLDYSAGGPAASLSHRHPWRHLSPRPNRQKSYVKTYMCLHKTTVICSENKMRIALWETLVTRDE